tara:strand:- start:1071 stop:1604 length:534 start_codon:yes stop_codon:yes gene_type:complete
MATFDLTSKDTTGVESNSIAVLPSIKGHSNVMRNIEAYLDIDALVAKGNSFSDGDIFQVLEIPANTLVLNAGAEVMKAFTSSCTLDMDFAAGDDIIDGADITSTGFCAAGTNGQTNTVVGSAASTYTQFVTTTDTIDAKIAGAAPATGRLRMYATVIDLSGHGLDDKADEVDRDQLA